MAEISDYQKAKAELNRLNTLKAAKGSEFLQEQDKLTALESGSGEALLLALDAGRDDTVTILKEIQAQRDKVNALNSLLFAIDNRIEKANRDVIELRCIGIMAEAEKVRKEAAKRQAKANELLKAIQDFEGCEYEPATHLTEYNGAQSFSKGISKTDTMLTYANDLELTAKAIKNGDPIPVSIFTGKAAQLPIEYN